MKRWVRLLAAAATLLSPCLLFAYHDPPDGIDLTVSLQIDPNPPTIFLEWTGGPALFQVYRSTTPQNLVDPANLLGETADTFWTDPDVGDLFYYKIASINCTSEVCDGRDNDCNHVPDDGIPPTICGVGECQRATSCQFGVLPPCTPGSPSPEVCDGKDNDCDGLTDDDLGSTTCGVGECRRTVQNCLGGIPQTCVPRMPSTEICDQLDNNCDGATDEGAGCFNLAAPCAVGQDCASTWCVDGVCCETACAGACASCNLAVPGMCAGYSQGTDPENECSGYLCDGAGACSNACGSDTDCAPTHVCETDMTCRPRCFSDGDCAGGYACRADQHCQPSCASDLECAAGYSCDVAGGQCLNANLFGARVSSGGVLLATDIPIQVEPYDQAMPAIAFDGTNYLVAWLETRYNPAGDVFVARYDPDGVANGPGPVQVEGSPGPIQSPAVAFGGGNYLVVWADGSGGSLDIRGARVSPAGIVLDDPSIPISTAPADQSEPAVAYNGVDFVVAWTDTRSGNPDIHGTFVALTPTGPVADPGGFSIAATPEEERSPAVAFNWTDYLVVWSRGTPGGGDIYASRVQEFATLPVLDPAGIPISAGAADESEPTVASDGTSFLVAWGDSRSGNGDVYATRVSAAGTVLDPFGVGLYLDPGLDAQPVLVHSDASTTGWVGVAFGNDDPSGGVFGDYRIRAVPLDTTPPGPPTVFTPIVASEGVQLRWNPVVGPDVAGYLLVWEDYRPVSSGPFSGQTDGETCALNADCASGFCTGGVCCDSACNLPNADSSCSTGACTLLSCHAGFADCNGALEDGCETPTDSNPDACGACGTVCSSSNMETRTCGGGVCNGVCVSGFSDCDGNKQTNGCEVDITSSTAHCGACNAACSANNMASLACTSGMCAGTCSSGFDDCNLDLRADGCETNLDSDPGSCGACGLSCNDASACTNDVCVASACRNVDRATCANIDPTNVNPTDPSRCGPQGCAVCNFAGSFPGCSNPDTDDDGLGDAWEDARAIDLDCDGDYDSNDVTIPDADKRVKDVYLKASAMANDPAETFPNLHRPEPESIESVVAAFAGSHLTTTPVRCDVTTPECPAGFTCSTEDFVCLPTCVADPECAAGVCAGGVCRLRRLHFEYAEINTIPHANVITYGPVQAACITGGDTAQGVNFYDIKNDPANFDPKKALFARYGLYGHFQSCDSTGTCSDLLCPDVGGSRPDHLNSGLAEVGGNDLIVTLDPFAFTLGAVPSAAAMLQKVRLESGGTLHEIGHTLRLHHGGPACDPLTDPSCTSPPGCNPLTDPSCTYLPDQNRKPNYVSVMNHHYNLGIPVAGTPGSVTPGSPPPEGDKWRVDFSHVALGAALDETNLSEEEGVSPGNPPPYETDLVKYFSPGFGPGTRYGSTMPGEGINWKVDDPVIATPVQVNINDFPPGPPPSETHSGAEDWSRLDYAFQCDPKFLDGASAPSGTLATDEIDPEIAVAVDALYPPVIPRIDVAPQCLDLLSNAVIPVTLFGSAELDVGQIDLSTVRLSEAAPVSVSFSDQDGDGFQDLVGDFQPSSMSLTPQSTRAVLTGRLLSGQSLQGEDMVDVVACALANADASCVADTCVIASCYPGFDDCDGSVADGCEVDITADTSHCGACSQACSSNNMASLSCSGGACNGTCAAGWGDCNADKRSDGCEISLETVADCGSCGNSCADPDPCTNDVCNPPGTCANVNGSACFQPACAGGPPGCSFTDSDGDGLNNTWETNGYIDNDCNGMNDPGIDTPLPNSDLSRPNIYVRYDYMVKAGSGTPCSPLAECPPGEQCVGGICTGHSHAPSPLALDLVTQAFLARNVLLTFDPVSQAIPETAVVTFDSLDPACAGPDAVSFYELKSSNFPPSLRTAYHYVVFAHFNTCDSPTSCAACPLSPDTGTQPVFGATGIAELMGNDAIVSLGALPSSTSDVTIRREAGTLMHELGHNLNLLDGGGDEVVQKPNYFSVMNPSYQFGIGQSAAPGPYATTEVDPSTSYRIDYSGQVLAPLNECGGLDEMIGVSGDPASRDVVKFFGQPGPVQLFAPSNMTPIDWNFNGITPDSFPVFADINGDGQCAVLVGFDDWPVLFYAFQCTQSFLD